MSVATKATTIKRGRRLFGEGLGERKPVHRLPVSVEDHEWWSLETQREEDRELDRLYRDYAAQQRNESGLDY